MHLLGAVLARFYVVPSPTIIDFPRLSYLISGTFVSYVTGSVLKAKERERALRLVFQQTLLSIGDAVISVDTGQKIEIMNRVAEQLSGWSEAEAKGKHLSDVFRVTTISGAPDLVTRTGELVPVDDSKSPICDKDGKTIGYIVIFRDVTSSRKAQQLLAAAERRSRTILESLTDSFMLLDKEWRFAFLIRQPNGALLARPATSSEKSFGRSTRTWWEPCWKAIAGGLWQRMWLFPLRNLRPATIAGTTSRLILKMMACPSISAT